MSESSEGRRRSTIAQISDMHLGSPYGEGLPLPEQTLEATIAALAEFDLDLLLLTGDNIDEGSLEDLHRLAVLVAPTNAPILATSGNHDDPALLLAVFGEATEANVAGWRIVTVDTTVPREHHGCVDVDALLATLGPDAGVPTVVAMHHPPITTSDHPWFQLTGAAELVVEFARRKDVRLVLSGHLHQAFHVSCGGVTYVGCSSSWYSLAHRANEYWRDGGHVGAVVVHLDPDGTFEWQRVETPNPQNRV